jgi:hypothetical protein
MEQGMTTKHSEGPWRYDYEPGYCGELIAADGRSVCTFADEPKPNDAKVLSAAPELLEALEALLDMDISYQRGPKVKVAESAARAAVAKARGVR